MCAKENDLFAADINGNMQCKMRYAQIRSMDISNGEGIGISLFTQGCPIRCPECHNSSIWDFNGGTEFTKETEQEIIKLLKPNYITRFSILGGEALLPQNYRDLYNLCTEIKFARPDIKIWLWSGYTFEEIWQHAQEDTTNYLFALLGIVDVLVDGPFIAEQRDITLKWRGSKNQRVIDLKSTLSGSFLFGVKLPEPVLYCD